MQYLFPVSVLLNILLTYFVFKLISERNGLLKDIETVRKLFDKYKPKEKPKKKVETPSSTSSRPPKMKWKYYE